MSKKILLADDSITIQKVIELTFSDEDFEVITVGNGRLAIERVQDVRPDLVLCDIIMPEKDGYEVCEFIKKNPSLSRTPVLLLTGAFEPFDQERATRVGCDGFLAKPFEPQTLIAKVKDLLARAGAAPAAPPATMTAAPSPAAATPAPPHAAAPAPAPPAVPAWVPYSPAPAAAAPAPREPETFAFIPETPQAYEPAPPPPTMPFEEAGVSFFTDETLEEPSDNVSAAAPPARSGETVPVPSFPETANFEEYRASAFDEVAPAASVAPSPARPAPAPPAPPLAAPARPAPVAAGFPALDEDEGPQTLLPMSSEEVATLRGTPAPAAPPARTPARAPLWTQQTMEVPLEARARASMEAVHMDSEPVFEEVFEPTKVPVARPAAPAPRPAPPAPPMPPPPVVAPAVATAAPPVASAPALARPAPARASHEDPATLSAPTKAAGAAVRSSVPSAAPARAAAVPAPPANSGIAPPAAAAAASGVSVPVDMVSQIAQRVVAQVSEKVIREIAWEVIPDLAEALIKKEIERLKAELQRT
jgi:CheY-like chemotaxis protein